MSATVRPLSREDWPTVERIYRDGIDTGHATFEAEPPSWDAFDATRRPDLRLVAETGGAVTGWAAASPVSARPVYAGVVEHSIYVDPAARGGGVGRILLAELLASARRAGVWTVQSNVFPENEESLALHTALGFRIVGVRERIGLMGYGPLRGQWRDTVLIERRLED
ncbi:GNAT family N-acetyltransferase [Amnibacterium flavum]|uniref:N-acetyltransferase n=1 Tax=Amnibacterium flavum TaxID=2173173 RepID=A0A2V1HYF7_9MICO|nr:GNAT family N-acetyltransferase [Amnibacterium flavum]PVZ95514.1 N-acetyltransferase [Amnibacterium flavum]